MAERTYKVKLTAGGHTWTVTDLDPPQAGLMDPLTIGWSIPEEAHRPTQPDVMVASFSLVVATAADVDDLVLGAPVTIQVTFGPVDKTAPDVAFYGRIAEGQAIPHRQGMLYRFTCADASTDWTGYDVGAAPYIVQSVRDRFAEMLARAPVDPANLIRDPVVAAVDPNLSVEIIDQPSAKDLRAATIELWNQVALPALQTEIAATVRFLAILAPYPGPSSTGLPFRYALDAVPDHYVPTALTPLPATFGKWFPDPQAYGLHIDPDDRAAGVIDACVVDFDATWASILPAAVNRSAVTWLTSAGWDVTYERTQQVTYTTTGTPPGQTPTTTTRETETIGYDPPSTTAAQANAARLGAMMVPVPQNPNSWSPDAFRWLLYKDPAGQAEFPVIFPRHDATSQPTPNALRTAAYVRPVVIAGIPGHWNTPDPRLDWVAGQLGSVQLTIEDGRPVIDFQLAPTIPEPGNIDTASKSWNARTGTWDAQTGQWDDLQPGRAAFRWSDAALVGRTWNQIHPQPWNMYRLARGS